jgi:hypothetical protein
MAKKAPTKKKHKKGKTKNGGSIPADVPPGGKRGPAKKIGSK